MLQSSKESERRKAIYELGISTNEESLHLLKTALDDSDIIVQRLAIAALGKSADTSVLPALELKFSTSASAVVKSDIARVLVNFSSSAVKNFLVNIFEDENPLVLKEAMDVAASLRIEETKAVILNFLKNQIPEIRKAAVQSVARYPIREAAGDLKNIIFSEPEPGIRSEILLAIARIAPWDIDFFSRVFAEESDPAVILEAGMILARSGIELDPEKLLSFLSSSDSEIRMKTAQIMTFFIKEKPVREAFETLRNDPDDKIKKFVESVLSGGKK